MRIRDRIKQLRRLRAGDLLPNPHNWRTHPDGQREALRGVLADIGIADALLVREVSAGRFELIDGHLRAEMTPDVEVPVLVLDVNEREAEKILLTLDPLAALATADQHQLRELIDRSDLDSPHVAKMLADLEQAAHLAPAAGNDGEDRPGVAIPELHQVVVECRDERQQQQLYEQLREEGYRCRVLTL